MRAASIKIVGLVVLAVGVLTVFLRWYPFFFALGWPSLGLARMGVPHSWMVTAIFLLGGMTALAFWVRRRSWVAWIVASVALPACYCALAFWFVARGAVPLPVTTPYDDTPAKRVAYLDAFESGYRDGSVGSMRSYCFYPEDETRGFYDGAYEGSVVWHRMLGRSMSDETKHFFSVSAARDGVKLDLK